MRGDVDRLGQGFWRLDGERIAVAKLIQPRRERWPRGACGCRPPLPGHGPDVHGRHSPARRCGQVDDHRRLIARLAAALRRCARHRPVESVQWRAISATPRAHAGPRHRRGRVHPLDGDAGSPGRLCSGQTPKRCGCSMRGEAVVLSRRSGSSVGRSRRSRGRRTRIVVTTPGGVTLWQAAKSGHSSRSPTFSL